MKKGNCDMCMTPPVRIHTDVRNVDEAISLKLETLE
jgi:hypothetical protein